PRMDARPLPRMDLSTFAARHAWTQVQLQRFAAMAGALPGRSFVCTGFRAGYAITFSRVPRNSGERARPTEHATPVFRTGADQRSAEPDALCGHEKLSGWRHSNKGGSYEHADLSRSARPNSRSPVR